MNIYDIAREAGVSPSTVSRVLNNKNNVKTATREKVLRVINNAGVQFGLNTHVLEITSGVLIIFAVTMDMLKARKKG